MVNKTKLKAGQHVVWKNYFGSICLQKKLSKKATAYTTIREDCCGGIPLNSKTPNKNIHGSMKEAFAGCVPMVKCKNNKVVSMASNKLRAEPMQKAKR